jgi:hypothetical protein
MAPFLVIPARALAAWKLSATTTVEGTLDGVPLGRRSLKRLDDASWFLELRRDFLERIGKRPADRAELTIEIASADLPAELQALIDRVPVARASWEGRTAAQQRMLREEVLAAKTAATRERRARRILLPAAKPARAPIAGLTREPRAVTVRIVGRRLPGRACGPYTDITVGLAEKVGCDPTDVHPADVSEAIWETIVQVREHGGAAAFRGPAVNGPPHERFLYLTWAGRKGRAAPAMFRRAKLRLDAIPPQVLVKALRSGLLVGRLELTAGDGMPVCASVRPPAIDWSAR